MNMRILLNSDVLHMRRPLATGLPTHVTAFCRDAAAVGAKLVLPTTTILEFSRHQHEVIGKAIAELEAAAELLRANGIKVPTHDARSVIGNADLVQTLRDTGVAVEVEESTIEDYRDAERRAALHLPPQAPGPESDEMRDLIIWAVAIRIAKHDGAAMIVSRDHVHVGEYGEVEAAGAGLVRARTFDDALELVGRASPAGALAHAAVAAVWEALRSSGLPLPTEALARTLSRFQFSADEEGHARVHVKLEVPTSDGLLSAEARIHQAGPSTIQAELSNLLLNGEAWGSGSLNVTAQGELPRVTKPVSERISALRAVLEARA